MSAKITQALASMWRGSLHVARVVMRLHLSSYPLEFGMSNAQDCGAVSSVATKGLYLNKADQLFERGASGSPDSKGRQRWTGYRPSNTTRGCMKMHHRAWAALRKQSCEVPERASPI